MSKKKDSEKRIAIIASNFNIEITDRLLDAAKKTLIQNNIPEVKIKIFRCPGAFEIPFIAKKLCESRKYAVIICLGAVIKGETAHFEFIAASVTSGIAKLNLYYNTPVIYGVLTCYTVEQAIARSADNEENRGSQAALAALEMIKLNL